MNVLMIDIGGTNVKLMVSGRDEMRKFPSGPTLTAEEMVAGVKAATADWDFDAVTIGFPGLVGTSIGAALVADDTIVPVELGLIPFTRRATFKTRLTKEARKKAGHKRWQKYVHESVALLQDIFWPHDTVIGGGNAKHLDPLPDHCRRMTNRDAIVGARRLWEGSDLLATPYGTTWRITKDGAEIPTS
jgi:predicted NBD/HSP70 family sugar kinase